MKRLYETEFLLAKESMLRGSFKVYDKEDDPVMRKPRATIRLVNNIAWLDLGSGTNINTCTIDLLKELMLKMEEDNDKPSKQSQTSNIY